MNSILGRSFLGQQTDTDEPMKPKFCSFYNFKHRKMFGEATMRLIWVFHNDVDNQFEGLGVATASRISKGTRVMHYHGKIISKQIVKKLMGVCVLT